MKKTMEEINKKLEDQALTTKFMAIWFLEITTKSLTTYSENFHIIISMVQ